jgi:hypothetical protein
MGISPGEAMALLESFLRAGSAQAVSIRVDWSKWRQFFRTMQENPLLERIFAALENQESAGSTSDWRSRTTPLHRQRNNRLFVRRSGSCRFRLRGRIACVMISRSPILTDSLMGVEIETSLEAALASPYRLRV